MSGKKGGKREGEKGREVCGKKKFFLSKAEKIKGKKLLSSNKQD